MDSWLNFIKTFLAEYWGWLLIGMLILYYLYDYVMLLVSIVVFPITVIGAGIWGLNKKVIWPDDEKNALTPGNFFFFLSGTLAFLIEIWLFSIFLEYYLLGESVMRIFGKWGVKMAVVSGIAFGLLTLIFGHLAHHLLSRSYGDRDVVKDGKKPPLSSERIVGWAAAFFFLVATLVLGYSGGLRAHTMADQASATKAVIFFSVAIGGIFGFMMPFGAVVGMSRGGFLWHIFRNVLLGIPLMLGMLLLIVAAFIFYLFEIVLNLATLIITKLYAIIAGFAGIKLVDREVQGEQAGWRNGVHQLLCSAKPPERLMKFLEHVKASLNFWDADDQTVKR